MLVILPQGYHLLSNQTTSKDTKSPATLVPQPHKSPNDLLILSEGRQELLFLTIVLEASATGVIGPHLIPAFGIIASFCLITLTQKALLDGSLVMALGASCTYAHLLLSIMENGSYICSQRCSLKQCAAGERPHSYIGRCLLLESSKVRYHISRWSFVRFFT
jgi:hypothetical protein